MAEWKVADGGTHRDDDALIYILTDDNGSIASSYDQEELHEHLKLAISRSGLPPQLVLVAKYKQITEDENIQRAKAEFLESLKKENESLKAQLDIQERKVAKLKNNQTVIRALLKAAKHKNDFGHSQEVNLTHYVRDELNNLLIQMIDDCFNEIEHYLFKSEF